MNYTHPELTKVVVEQTPRAMFAMIIVSTVYMWIFIKYVPLVILLVWFSFQILLVMYRLYNGKMLSKYLEQKNQALTRRHENFFLISNIFQAFMWTIASVLAVIYAPQPFELITFVLIIGIITAATLSMSALYKAYLVFFFLMIIPQIMIMLYYGEHQHIGLVILAIIYMPATILLSRAIYTSRLSSIESNDALQESVEKLHKLSVTDSLTNIYNRRYFFEIVDNMISLAIREQKKVSLLMIDIDHFKKVNDVFGHQVGDFILVSFVDEVKKVMRKSDIFARVGGEEFSILLHDTSLEGARIISEKIREKIENREFTYNGDSIKITVSIGVSELNQNNNSVESLYKQADELLYIAKENGRNRVH